MGEHDRRTPNQASRIARHRRKIAAGAAKRVEVTVPDRDVPLVKAIAAALRADGDDTKEIRTSLGHLKQASYARTGRELVAFFRASPPC